MAANREAGVWRDPTAVDVERFNDPSAPKLLSFGAGPHYCLGASLARLTLEEVVGAVLDASAAIGPSDDLAAVPWRFVLGRSPACLPVRLRS
jgi:cytochrome P450